MSIFNVRYSTLLRMPPLTSTVSETAVTEPRTITTLALTVRRSKPLTMNSARSHPQKGYVVAKLLSSYVHSCALTD